METNTTNTQKKNEFTKTTQKMETNTTNTQKKEWYNIIPTTEKNLNFDYNNPEFIGNHTTGKGDQKITKEIQVKLEQKHLTHLRLNAHHISVQGTIKDDQIKPDKIISYDLKTLEARIGFINKEEKNKTTLSIYDIATNKNPIYLTYNNKFDSLTQNLKVGDIILAKGFLYYSKKGHQYMNGLHLKPLTKTQSQDKSQIPYKKDKTSNVDQQNDKGTHQGKNTKENKTEKVTKTTKKGTTLKNKTAKSKQLTI